MALLLLIAGANVTGLMVVRAQSRRREAAVQCALGIGGGRLFRARLLETLLVTGAAAAGGIAFAAAALPVFVALGPADMPRLEQAAVNGTSAALAALLAVGLALAMTSAASPRPGRRSLVAWLRDGAHGATAGRAGAGARNTLVVSQVAMALVLTVGAGLLAASYVNLARVDRGALADEQVPDLVFTEGRRGGLEESGANRLHSPATGGGCGCTICGSRPSSRTTDLIRRRARVGTFG